MSWGHPSKGRLRFLAAFSILSALLLAGPLPASAGSGGPKVSVIVREHPGSGNQAETLVRSLGGRVGRHIRIIDGFEATLPAAAVAGLGIDASVASVTRNSRVRLAHAVDGFDASADAGSMYTIAQEITRAGDLWHMGITGEGVDVAVIDSGVVPVDGLTSPGKVVNGPDLSFESQSPQLRYLDTYGHGTHMAGIIAGRDDAVPLPMKKGNHHQFTGMAPEARIVSVKVADANGVTDVSQVLAAIDWVVQHRRDGDLNIRVLNLSFGTDGIQDYVLDPLTYAVEVAWRKGIVVVVAAGNEGYGSPRLNNPAYDPYVIAVGAADPKGTYGHPDDVVAPFSSCGTPARRPDLLAPGTSIVSLRDPGSTVDLQHPEGLVGSRFFRGSGTSQAAAVVSGAAALIVDQRPSITPDQVKALLMASAVPLFGQDPNCQGAGILDLKSVAWRSTPLTVQAYPPATGLGSLEAARGSAHITDGTADLVGEMDIFGSVWDGAAWSVASLAETSWQGGLWNGKSWSGDAWSAISWAGKSWSSVEWSGKSWSGKSWSGKSWSDLVWSGKSWSGKSWSDLAWSGKSWSGKSWGSEIWSSVSWGS
ncbi:MAG TPA: S8 family serine peptidase [Actinomycetota bacterium]|nr:S8 family serine peptidase [Actinomycetota bacterium]